MNLSMIPAEVDPRVRQRLDREADEVKRKADDARAAESANHAAYHHAHDAWDRASDELIAAEDRGADLYQLRERADRLGRALDVAFASAINATHARQAVDRRLAELDNPTLIAQIARREQEKRERLDLLSAERERLRAEEAGANGSAVTRIVETKRRRGDYPQVVDNGDGLAQLDRESLRILCRENSMSVAGHKAVVIERLRAAGVTP